jgi:Helix-turn-helix
LQPDERTPPPRPRPTRDGAPLTEAELGQALRELRDTWAGLTQVTLAKWAGLSDSVVSARELGHGMPSTKVLDKFVITCLKHRGLTPQKIVGELAYWHDARKALDLQRRQQAPTLPTPQPDPAPDQPEPALAPVTAVRDDSTQQIAPEATNDDADSPDPAPDTLEPEGASPRWTALTRRWWVIGVVAVSVVAVVVVGVIGLPSPHGPQTAAEADRQLSPRAATPTQPLVHSPPYVAGTTYSQTVHSPAGARTYANPYGMAGEGERIPNHMAVRVSCKIVAPGASSVGTYWYRIADPPWKDYYSPTNSFLNDDPISGSHKKAVDESVPYCPS